ncbi:hypothetical protein OFB79_25470, partial [Escherichia coli]|nr:hypothetical protein [Escherichia coli]
MLNERETVSHAKYDNRPLAPSMQGDEEAGWCFSTDKSPKQAHELEPSFAAVVASLWKKPAWQRVARGTHPLYPAVGEEGLIE